MNKEDVLDIISELESDVQNMRDEGETDLRTVLHYIRDAYYRIKALD